MFPQRCGNCYENFNNPLLNCCEESKLCCRDCTYLIDKNNNGCCKYCKKEFNIIECQKTLLNKLDREFYIIIYLILIIIIIGYNLIYNKCI